MILDINYVHKDYVKDILPYIRNAIFIDTSVMKIFINGFITTRFSKKKDEEFEKLLAFFDIIKVSDKWNKFYVTPHVLAEICRHLNNDYRKHHDYKEKVEEILPILKELQEIVITKEKIIGCVDLKNPILEIGDISIFLATEEFIDSSKKVAILVKDERFNEEYEHNLNVMIMDYNKIILNRM